ncbi:hypothetical protein [Streptosporangium amethystogenes]|uniref:hypothetical protein n=1 Tax=Streptosporangium amethystogenes TaxID=2002 RepID=UPI0004CA0870|nr:hypothetical protein [Streptosporangium amethystogenes]
MNTRSRFAVLAGALMVSTCLVAAPAQANAAAPCGGYRLIDTYRIPKSGPKKGVIELYYNSGNGKNCAIARGSRVAVTNKAVTLSLTGGGQAAHEHGRFAQYAGPVYISARSKCIDITGVIGKAVRTVRGVHCG